MARKIALKYLILQSDEVQRTARNTKYHIELALENGVTVREIEETFGTTLDTLNVLLTRFGYEPINTTVGLRKWLKEENTR